MTGYTSISVDSIKVPNFGGDLVSMEIFSILDSEPDAELLYTYRSSDQPPSQFDGKPVGIYFNSTNNKFILLDFPLYYMVQSEAEQLLTKALIDFGEVVGIEDDETQYKFIPTEFKLYQNYPNPFNPVTTIKFDLPEAVQVSLKIYNTIGEQLTVLINTELEAGNHQIEFDASHLSSGIYFYELRAEEYKETKKMLMIK
jgi:hypothetical protein